MGRRSEAHTVAAEHSDPRTPTRPGGSFGRVLFVHAHPDDETITTGGAIATLIAAGSLVTVLTCTRGERGEIVPADLQYLLAEQPGPGQGDAVASHREGELADAMAALGVLDHRWLGAANARVAGGEPRRYRDSGMAWGESGPVPVPDLEPDALWVADPGEIAADIATVIADTGATAVISYNERGGYGHPDHVVTAASARRAAAVLGVEFWEIDDPDPGVAVEVDTAQRLVLDVRPVLARKVAALRAHRSQLTVTGDDIVMSGGQVSPIGLDERFRRSDLTATDRVGATQNRGRAWTSPFAWSDFGWRRRAVVGSLTVAAGCVVGAITTIAHQSYLILPGVVVPLGLIVGLAVIAAVLVGLRLVFVERALPVLATVGILGTIVVLSQESAGGSVLVPAEPLAAYWVYGPVVIAFLALAWPNLAQARRDRLAITSSSNGSSPP